MRRLVSAQVCMTLILMGLSTAAFAQSQTGNIVGKVTDDNGGPLPGAVVLLDGPRNSRDTVTNEDGVYRFPLLDSGNYTVTASMTGMRSAKKEVSVRVGKNTIVDFGLSPSTVTETLVVTGESQLVDVTDVSTGGNIEVETFETAAVGRSYQAITALVPGVTGGGNPNVNGALDGDNQYLVDGVNITDPTTGTFGLNLNFEAIQEVEVITGAASAEFGQSTGATINVVTKSGTNQYEGSVRWVMTNEDWNSRSPFDVGEARDELIDIPTFTLGGPIIKDQLWFFGAFEEGTSSSVRGIATGQTYNRDFTNTYQTFKLTWSPSQNHTVALTYSEDPATVPVDYWGTTGDLAVINQQTQGGDTYSLRWDWVISDAWYSEIQAGTQDSGITVAASPFQSPDPNLATGFYFDLVNGFGYNDTVFNGAVLRPRDQFAWRVTHFTSYGHEFKAGLDYQKTESTNRFDLYGLALHFGNDFNRNAPGGYDTPLFVRNYVPADDLTSENTQLAFFFIDTFSVGDNWTFNLGVRVEQQEGINDVGETVVDSTDIAPRLNAVYDFWADGRLALTASYGRYYSPVIQGLVDDFNRGVGGGAIYDVFNWNPATLAYDTFSNRVDTSGNNRTIDQIDPYYEDEWILGVEYQFHPIWVAKAKIISSEVNNIFDTVTDFDANGNLTSTFTVVDDAVREYTGLQLEFERRFQDNWQIAGNLVFGEAEGNFFSESDSTFGDFASTTNLGRLNRTGPAPYNVDTELKLWGRYLWDVGYGNVLTFGGNFNWETGGNWARTRIVQAPLPDGSDSTETITEFLEARGTNTLPSFWGLDASVLWEFSFISRLRTSILIESFNLFNNDTQIGVDTITGEARNSRADFQAPRSWRVTAGVRF